MTLEEKYNAAVEAIQRLCSDTAASQKEIKVQLTCLGLVIDAWLDALNDDE